MENGLLIGDSPWFTSVWWNVLCKSGFQRVSEISNLSLNKKRCRIQSLIGPKSGWCKAICISGFFLIASQRKLASEIASIFRMSFFNPLDNQCVFQAGCRAALMGWSSWEIWSTWAATMATWTANSLMGWCPKNMGVPEKNTWFFLDMVITYNYL